VVAIIALLLCLCVAMVVRNRDAVKTRLYAAGLLDDPTPPGAPARGTKDAFDPITPHSVDGKHPGIDPGSNWIRLACSCCRALYTPTGRKHKVQPGGSGAGEDLEGGADDTGATGEPEACDSQALALEDPVRLPPPLAPPTPTESETWAEEVAQPPLPPPTAPLPCNPTASPGFSGSNRPPLVDDCGMYLQAGHRIQQPGGVAQTAANPARQDFAVGATLTDVAQGVQLEQFIGDEPPRQTASDEQSLRATPPVLFAPKSDDSTGELLT